MNTGFGSTTDTGLHNSGFGNTGTGDSGFGNTGTQVSGFINSLTGPGAGATSGFGNTASGGSNGNADISGYFNRGITGPIFGHPSGYFSGADSGLLNFGTAISGLISLGRLF